jgi:AraC-like DNA-binding protein
VTTTAQATVSVAALVPFLRLLEDAGADMVMRAAELSTSCFERHGIATSELDARARLPHALIVELHEVFVELLDDPSAPLRAGQKLRAGDYELLELLCCSTNTLGESIACLGRYYPLLIQAEHDLVIEGDRAEARFQIAPGLPAPDSFHEFALASNFTMAALHIEVSSEHPPPLPLEVRFTHKAPPYAALFERVFFAPVSFGQPHNAIVFPTKGLDTPMRTRDPVLHAVLTRQADRELAELWDRSAFPSRVLSAIEAELEQGAELPEVARRLHMSEGALRTKLRQHGTTHSALRDRVRRERAARALRQSSLGIAEIGHQLGFAHPPAFHRAVRRWFGVSPSALREAGSDTLARRFFKDRAR